MPTGTRTLCALAGLVAYLVALGAPLADVATDGTLGRRARLTGKDVRVGAELGQARGKNLFHSFERFGVERGGRVTFTGPDGLENVISRVTGGEASRIDGTLASEVAGADLYLVNPAGIVFGPGGRLDVPGSFHASTADEVRLGDGTVFSALDPVGSVLSVAAPEAFGFLGRGGGRGAVTVDGGVLAVPPGEALSLVGGEVAIGGDGDGLAFGPDAGEPEPGTVQATAGRVALVAMDGAGAVLVATGEAVGDRPLAPVRVSRDSLVDASGDGGGAVLIRGGRFVLEGESFVFADNTGGLDARVGAGVAIEAREARIVSGSGMTADSFAGGAGGRLVIRAGRLELSGGGSLGTNAFGGGSSGTVTVAADTVVVDGAGVGDQFLPSSIQSGVFPGSAGDAGSVTVEAGRLELVGGGQIFSGTFGEGDGGTVRVAADSVLVAGTAVVGGRPIPSAILVSAEAGSAGAAGTAVVEAGELEVRDGGRISSGTRGGGAGQVRVTAERSITVDDGGSVLTNSRSGEAAGDVSVQAPRVVLRGDGLIGSSGFGASPAGDVSLSAGDLLVEDAAIRTEGEGAAGGRITVVADDLIHLEAAEITSNGIQPQAGASLITLRAPLIALLDGSRVTSLTNGRPLQGSGEARLEGDLTFISEDSLVDASTTVELAGVDNQVGSGLQLPAGAFVDTSGLLGEGCAARQAAGRASSFTRTGRGGLPPSPDRPLASVERGGRQEGMRVGEALLVASACGS